MSIKVLLAEDEPVLRELIVEFFVDAGFKVVPTDSGKSALEEFKKQTFDFVISDYRMPNGDGIFLVSEIKKTNAPMPFVFIVTGDGESNTISAKSLGIDGIIEKPFNPADLVSRINDLAKTKKSA
jgi:DNA-binding response OmpR family regulator